MIDIQNLHATVESPQDEGTVEILKGINLTVKPGEIHAIMGPNGSGKSTLAKAVVGHPAFTVTQGDVKFNRESILDKDPEERARMGLFMAFQYPVEVPGVNNAGFLRLAYNAKQKHLGLPEVDELAFQKILEEKAQLVKMNPAFLNRAVNEGFSGGEKKRNEILQMAVLDPTVAFLDETDSGLDIDALRTVADGVNTLMAPDKAIILVTHYQRLLDYIKPDVVHVLARGRIIKTGGKELALTLEEKGYDWLLDEQEAAQKETATV